MAPKKNIIKSVRMDERLLARLEAIKEIQGKSLQDIALKALNNYADFHDKQNNELAKELNNNDDLMGFQEYMYIPVKYYALYNNISIYDAQKLVKTKQIKSIQIGDIRLILIDMSESIYRKSELIVIKNNVTSVMKEVNNLKKEVYKLRREQKKGEN